MNKKRVLTGLSLFVIVLLLLAAGYTWLSLKWSYSDGERAGFVQKISKKGWLCKTWEGEMLMLPTSPLVTTEKFFFTVRDEAIAKQISANIGKRMSLSYSQHIGIPSTCFGDTEYFIEKVQVDQTIPQ